MRTLLVRRDDCRATSLLGLIGTLDWQRGNRQCFPESVSNSHLNPEIPGNAGADDFRVRTGAILKMVLSSMTAVSRPYRAQWNSPTPHFAEQLIARLNTAHYLIPLIIRASFFFRSLKISGDFFFPFFFFN